MFRKAVLISSFIFASHCFAECYDLNGKFDNSLAGKWYPEEGELVTEVDGSFIDMDSKKDKKKSDDKGEKYYMEAFVKNGVLMVKSPPKSPDAPQEIYICAGGACHSVNGNQYLSLTKVCDDKISAAVYTPREKGSNFSSVYFANLIR